MWLDQLLECKLWENHEHHIIQATVKHCRAFDDMIERVKHQGLATMEEKVARKDEAHQQADGKHSSH
jgi:hypothetical protein